MKKKSSTLVSISAITAAYTEMILDDTCLSPALSVKICQSWSNMFRKKNKLENIRKIVSTTYRFYHFQRSGNIISIMWQSMETFHRKKVIILKYLKEKGIYLPVGRDDDSLKGQALIDNVHFFFSHLITSEMTKINVG